VAREETVVVAGVAVGWGEMVADTGVAVVVGETLAGMGVAVAGGGTVGEGLVHPARSSKHALAKSVKRTKVFMSNLPLYLYLITPICLELYLETGFVPKQVPQGFARLWGLLLQREARLLRQPAQILAYRVSLVPLPRIPVAAADVVCMGGRFIIYS
jgi:hypothetical protein